MPRYSSKTITALKAGTKGFLNPTVDLTEEDEDKKISAIDKPDPKKLKTTPILATPSPSKPGTSLKTPPGAKFIPNPTINKPWYDEKPPPYDQKNDSIGNYTKFSQQFQCVIATHTLRSIAIQL